MEELKKAIISAVPAIVELRFGCEIKIIDYDDKYGDDYPLEQTFIYEIDGEIKTTVGTIEHDFKIIGRPITIADVLIAIQKHIRRNNGSEVWEQVYTEYLIKFLSLWYLEDNLENQSPELIESLKKLLVK